MRITCDVPGDHCIRGLKKSELPKIDGFQPVKCGIFWYLSRLETCEGQRATHTILTFHLVDPYSYWNDVR